MPTYNAFIKIKNGFTVEMNDGISEITQGKLKTKFPTTIAGGITTPNIEVDGLNSGGGSAGSFAYNVVIGGHTRQIFVEFACNSADEDFVIVKSSIPSIIDVNITPYSQVDHPLRATVTISLAKKQ